LVKRDHQVQVVTVRVDLVFADPHAQPDVTAADDRLVAVVRAHVQADARGTLGQGIAGLVQSVARCASNAYGELVAHRILLAASVSPNTDPRAGHYSIVVRECPDQYSNLTGYEKAPMNV